MRRTIAVAAAGLLSTVPLASACGDDQAAVASDGTESSITDTATDDAPTEATTADETASSEPDTAATGAGTDEADADPDVVIQAALAGGEVTVEDRRIEVPLGSSVGVEVTSDEAEQVHIHGYDLLFEVGAGIPSRILFVADSPGTFEVELERSGRFLFELLVR
jgi:hypothetical protein